MFSVILILTIFICESSLGSFANEHHFHKMILNSLNLTELNVSTLNVLLTKLNLRNCSASGTKHDCRFRCLNANDLFETHGLSTSKIINARDLAKLSTSLLYFLLPEKNAGAKSCKNGDQPDGTVYELLLQYYETNGLICARLLDRILQDLKNEFRNNVSKRNCASAVDFFSQMNLSTQHNELDEEQFLTVSIMIISHILNGSCVKVEEHHNLPCKSYFSSDILKYFGGVSGRISFESFEKMLEIIGLGNESGHGDESDDVHDHHDHRRRKRDTSNKSVGTHVDTDNHRQVEKCFSAEEFAEIFSINKSIGFDNKAITEICPALIQQLVSKSCVEAKVEDESHDDVLDKYVWLYGFVSVLVISLLALAGVAVIPSMKKGTYKKIIIVLVGLAIGTLAGDALFHLIPHAAGFHASSHGHGHESEPGDGGKAFLWKFLVVASGVYGFFLFETFTHLFLRSGGHGHSHRIEHTRKHSPFERNNSCRTVERHEMRLASLSETSGHDTAQVIFNKVTGKAEEKKGSKPPDHNHDNNIPSLLSCSSDSSERKISSVGWMIIIGDTIHNITDGIAIGAAFTQDIGGGLSTSIAVFCHELPHELGDFAVLVSSGMTVKQAMLANFLSACSSFIGLIIGILIGQQTEEGNQWVFAVMGGMFLYIALVDMLPELMHSEELGGAERLQIFLLQNTGMLLGFLLMLLIAYFEEDLVITW